MTTDENDFDNLVYSFFKKFSRFEYALKEVGLLRQPKTGSPAEAGWAAFVQQYQNEYTLTKSAKTLIELNPKKQRVGENNSLPWKAVEFSKDCTELCKIDRLLRITRNNVFHGGKNNAEGWDGGSRATDILENASLVLEELALFADQAGAVGFNIFFTCEY
ncbi:MAG: hypothetical protein COB08_007995 [Rhodobacteraceae bacterium]|nr:hypothetical protein [Paracoccaceae bacterium]